MSIGELTSGVRSLIFFVTFPDRSTWFTHQQGSLGLACQLASVIHEKNSETSARKCRRRPPMPQTSGDDVASVLTVRAASHSDEMKQFSQKKLPSAQRLPSQ